MIDEVIADELNAAWNAAIRGPIGPFDQLWPLVSQGVPVDLLTRPTLDMGVLTIGIQDGRWMRRAQGDRAIILPVTDDEGELIDLVAFRIETPRSFWTLEGRGALLGKTSLAKAAHFGESLAVHETPLDWLRASRKGIVIIDWRRYWPLYFSDIPSLQFANRDFARRAQASFSRPWQIPEIMVPA